MGMARPEEGGMIVERKENLCQPPEYTVGDAAYIAEIYEREKARTLRLSEIQSIIGDTYNLDRLRELVEADKNGRCVVLPNGGYIDKDGENALKSAMHTCFYHNNPVTRFIADAVAEKLVRNETKMKHCEGMTKNV